MKLHQFSILLMVLIIFGCDYKKDESIEETTLDEAKENKKEEVKKPRANLALTQWNMYYTNKAPGFEMKKFSKKDAFELVKHSTTTPAIWSSEYNPVHKQFLRYNQDSTKYVDFLSYKLKFDDNNEVILAPDQEIIIGDIHNRKAEQLLFYGPSYWVEDAYFKNDSILVLLENSTENIPAYQEINLNSLQSTYYTYNEPLDFTSHYLKNKILKAYQDHP